ncbi:MAG: choice-of-anchor D domain-containing protein [Desulfococcaceae bacterium]|jgi:hypothetical protein|nr:choice-of-anchor D domain-containing protein [Desulfococcaceae bacterium]
MRKKYFLKYLIFIILLIALSVSDIPHCFAVSHPYLQSTFTYTTGGTTGVSVNGQPLYSCKITWPLKSGYSFQYLWEKIEGNGWLNAGENSVTVDYWYLSLTDSEIRLNISDNSGTVMDTGTLMWNGSAFVEKEPVPEISVSPLVYQESLEILDSFATPTDYPYGMAFDGEYLWITDFYFSDKIFKLDTRGNTISSFSSPGRSPMGLTYDGTYLWNLDSDDMKIYQLDKNGNIISSFSISEGEYAGGLTYDETYLWHSNRSDKKIYQTDTSGNIISSINSPGDSPAGMTYDGRYLWIANWYSPAKIYQMEINGNVVNEFDAPGNNAKGMTFDGEFLWLADSGTDKIYKYRMPGITVGSSSTETFTVKNSGISLLIGFISISGADVSEFHIQNNNCSNRTLATGQEATVQIVFSPTSPGVKNAVLRIPSNDPNIPVLEVPLRGTGKVGEIGKGNVNGDITVDLKDAILSLKIASGIPVTSVYKEADVNGDGKIGVEEGIFALRKTASL